MAERPYPNPRVRIVGFVPGELTRPARMRLAIALSVDRASVPATKRRVSIDRWAGGWGPPRICSPPGTTVPSGGHPGPGRPSRAASPVRCTPGGHTSSRPGLLARIRARAARRDPSRDRLGRTCQERRDERPPDAHLAQPAGTGRVGPGSIGPGQSGGVGPRAGGVGPVRAMVGPRGVGPRAGGGHPGRGRPGRAPARLRFRRPVRLGRHRRP